MKTGIAVALVALGLLSARGEESFSSLLSQLKSDDYAERYEAARDLASVEGDARLKAIPALIAGLDDKSLPFRWRCTRSLAALTGQDFGRDHDRWEAWWKTGPVLPATEPVPAPVPTEPVPAPPVRAMPAPALEARARTLQRERNALEVKAKTLMEERDRMADEESHLRSQMESLRKERDRLIEKARSAEPAPPKESEQTQRMATELARLKEESERQRVEADRRARELETLRGTLASAGPDAVASLRARVQSLERDLVDRSAALGQLQVQYREALDAARKTAPAPAPSPPAPASPDEASVREVARLKEECERRRAEAEQSAREIAALREKLAATQAPPRTEKPPADAEATPASRDLDAWRSRHQTMWKNIQHYVIQKDDSLSTIAHRFHTDVDTLLELNRDHPEAVQDRHHIYAGYRIAVPAP